VSDLSRLRARLSRAEGQLRRRERDLEDLREQYRAAGKDEQTELTRRGQAAHLLRDAAREDVRKAWAALEAEEHRLSEPGAYLRFT
jgi:hypothetical protein